MKWLSELLAIGIVQAEVEQVWDKDAVRGVLETESRVELN